MPQERVGQLWRAPDPLDALVVAWAIISASYGRALLAEFQTNPAAAQGNGTRPDPARAEG